MKKNQNILNIKKLSYLLLSNRIPNFFLCEVRLRRENLEEHKYIQKNKILQEDSLIQRSYTVICAPPDLKMQKGHIMRTRTLHISENTTRQPNKTFLRTRHYQSLGRGLYHMVSIFLPSPQRIVSKLIAYGDHQAH